MKTDLLLLATAAIWGFAFVAQRAAMEFVGPFLFNAVRFALGAVVLLPVIYISGKKNHAPRVPVKYGLLAGLILFAGASLQQTGLIYTTAGNAGFVTGLYVVIVPVMGLIRGHFCGKRTWAGAGLAVSGLFLLTTAGSSRMFSGDIIVFAGAVFWAFHIQLISRLMKQYDALSLAALQFTGCSLLSGALALLTEKLSFAGIRMAALPILYGGLVSVGIAYTLQIIAQKRAHPAHAAIIMSLEAVFALIGGWVMLAEPITVQGTAGGVLMLTAMVLSARGQEGKRRVAGL
ncbi:MAG: DMT family transporter [Candidatus Fermentibacteria bacterium]